ncbi:uncharacterized protein N7506_002096 [Penicillium brevicompactum]|uniref:uncharacterized protein n=1 Tax=Penicillium brevicompactum TaxID=5074 RepID=UPI002540F661|nr:uncharacterized protein N7506_002096 [Penicillium brevicompactum]KAJ5348843.1 hypothetical protein N7506_002096 [Penicillium brevicompactum]
MVVDKIQVSGDSRVEYKTANLNGHTYSYLLSQPKSGTYKATIFLIHGFPDISMGWRYQIPMLVDMGLRVVAPDCLGYGRTDAPDDFTPYSHKSCAADIKALATHLGETQIILGGHDWGAAFAYRIALWYPELVSHLFTVCVPYARPMKEGISLESLVQNSAPHFAYQLQFKSGELEKVIRSKSDIGQFLLALYGGRTEAGEVGFDAHKGVLVDKIGGLKPSRLLTEEELEYYTNEFARSGVHGPLNWYRTREVNHREELEILDRQIQIPTLFIQALRDQALPPHLGKSMAKHIPNFTLKQVNTSHWALWEKPEEVNVIISDWLKENVFVGRAGKL